MALIEDAAVISRILRHLGVPTEIPAPRPARAPPLSARNSQPGWLGRRSLAVRLLFLTSCLTTARRCVEVCVVEGLAHDCRDPSPFDKPRRESESAHDRPLICAVARGSGRRDCLRTGLPLTSAAAAAAARPLMLPIVFGRPMMASIPVRMLRPLCLSSCSSAAARLAVDGRTERRALSSSTAPGGPPGSRSVCPERERRSSGGDRMCGCRCR